MKNSFFEVSPPRVHLLTCIPENVWKPPIVSASGLDATLRLGLTYELSNARVYTSDCVLCFWVCDCRSCCWIQDFHVLGVDGIKGLVPMYHGTKHKRLRNRQTGQI